MKKSFFFWVFLIGISLSITAQVRIRNSEELNVLKQTPMESVYAHLSSSLLFPGEYLYYSIYCFNNQSLRLSNISKMAYLQLIDATGKVYLTQKIPLDNGKGQGDLFLSTDFPSGGYQVKVFTHWMINAGKDAFFSADINVLNPYKIDQSGLNISDSTALTALKVQEELEDPLLVMETDTSTYGRRSPVRLDFRNYKGNLTHGTYSVSVRRKDDLRAAPLLNASGFGERIRAFSKSLNLTVNDILAIPEQRGELVSGEILDSENGAPLEGQWVAISLPGEYYQVKTALTDREGQFYSYISKPYKGEKGLIELMGDAPKAKVTMNSVLPDSYNPNEIYQLSINSKQKEAILNRSIHNQIENAYYEVKPDTVISPEFPDPYNGEIPLEFDLDTYTRFPTIRETLVEVVKHVWTRKNADNSYSFWVRQPMDPVRMQGTVDPPIVAIDGVFIKDHNTILAMDARRIKKILVLREKYQLAGQSYQGMVILRTTNGNYADEADLNDIAVFEYQPPLEVKNYFEATYASQKQSRIPDYRYQLIWKPELRIDSPEHHLEFFSSDVPGEYEVVLQGFTDYGRPITLISAFEVR